MNKRKLNKVFEIIKTKAQLDYAVMNADDYEDKFHNELSGIYVKRGRNACVAFRDIDSVYIGHDLTAEQAETLIATFQENGYDIEPKVYEPSVAFEIREVE